MRHATGSKGAAVRLKVKGPLGSTYLVDPASSHMLVSKIKPCTSMYNPDIIRETADGSLDQLWFIGVRKSAMDNCGNSRANKCN